MPGNVTINGRPWATIAGHPGETSILYGGAKMRFSKKRLQQLANDMLVEWQRLAKEMVPAKYIDDYLAAMSVNVRGDGIEMVLGEHGVGRADGQPAGLNALRVELGWRPPDGRGRHFNEGLGEWDGTAHDMRSFMLTEHGESRVVRFDEAKSFDELVADVTQKYGEDAAAIFGRGLKALKASGKNPNSEDEWRGTKSLKRKWTEHLAPERRWTVGPPEGKRKPTYRQHKYPLYHQIVKNYTKGSKPGRVKFTVFRTIMESDEQKRRHLWWTIGTKPVGVLQELEPVLREELKRMVAEKVKAK